MKMIVVIGTVATCIQLAVSAPSLGQVDTTLNEKYRPVRDGEAVEFGEFDMKFVLPPKWFIDSDALIKRNLQKVTFASRSKPVPLLIVRKNADGKPSNTVIIVARIELDPDDSAQIESALKFHEQAVRDLVRATPTVRVLTQPNVLDLSGRTTSMVEFLIDFPQFTMYKREHAVLYDDCLLTISTIASSRDALRKANEFLGGIEFAEPPK